MSGKRKGNQFERDICVKLSKWWTSHEQEPRDDVFWRTSNSGGRATVRGKKSKKTRNQYGDIAAVDPIGQPLLDLVTIELKRGYGRETIQDLLDDPNVENRKNTYFSWIEQAQNSSIAAHVPYWLLIVKRDRRDTFVLMDKELAGDLVEMANEFITVEINRDGLGACGCRLQDFLDNVDRGAIEHLINTFFKK